MSLLVCVHWLNKEKNQICLITKRSMQSKSCFQNRKHALSRSFVTRCTSIKGVMNYIVNTVPNKYASTKVDRCIRLMCWFRNKIMISYKRSLLKKKMQPLLQLMYLTYKVRNIHLKWLNAHWNSFSNQQKSQCLIMIDSMMIRNDKSKIGGKMCNFE